MVAAMRIQPTPAKGLLCIKPWGELGMGGVTEQDEATACQPLPPSTSQLLLQARAFQSSLPPVLALGTPCSSLTCFSTSWLPEQTSHPSFSV